MNRNLLFYFTLILFCFSQKSFAQTYQLSGNPVNTTGWDVVPSASVNTDFIQLTANLTGQVGGIKLNSPINLKFCDKWRVEFDFRIDGTGTPAYGNGDGLAFWYLANPPASYTAGGGLGIPANATGLMVGFDIFNNSTEAQMSKVHVLYGVNNTAGSNIEYNNTAGSTFHTPDLIATQPFVGPNYKHVEVQGQVNPANLNNWIITIKIDNVTVVNQSFAPSGAAVGMTQGYFGFSASTGAASARHSVKNVKVYTDKVSLLQNSATQTYCPNPTTGLATANLNLFNSQFVANPSNYTITYSVGGTPITNPTNYQFSANTTVSVSVKDNSGLLCDNPDGQIQLSLSPFTATNTTISECNNNNSATATFNLTSANVSSVPGITKKYFRTMADLNAGINEITTPTAFISGPTTVYVKVTTPQGCTGTAQIVLTFLPLPVVNDATLQACSIETTPTFGLFNLTSANVTSETGITKKFYTTLANALAETNEIQNPILYISTSTDVYVRVTSTNNCFIIKKITLKVITPVKSTVLKDKIICIDERTTLDAGPGFDEYEWSTGATTQSIQGVPVGTYWVKLKTGNCYITQTVTVKSASNPVISSLDITNNTITVNVEGGTAPYQYSLDGIKWQNSNILTGLPRGENKIFVKDFYNCEPVHVQITVPNLLNVITPNGDNINDFIDYTALAYKKNLVFTVYDRYGNKKFEADKMRNFKWDGTSGSKKVMTGTYWYTITWNENDKDNTQTSYNGWVLVKNIE
ncbi:T9SS type B sorting domain-containing protein [Chryseobacterium aquaticum]|uniref:T9SS type B sorting domain-containing protein n=1 Tax=Chryseobacterium aquaticum TaxID=452084 RepID=A0A848N5I7_9FLAO|nr:MULTISPECIES: gliding motility-associated C-terminal domain-containing protein [Chryseobacterium]NMR33771.1 T9SS type B sorting domain-containing protein [Chryseobacterium aquaticum]NRQ45847.1 gliding motility-associated C-terminal domain-containing protein [Chryseobacterium sp. C-204]